MPWCYHKGKEIKKCNGVDPLGERCYYANMCGCGGSPLSGGKEDTAAKATSGPVESPPPK